MTTWIGLALACLGLVTFDHVAPALGYRLYRYQPGPAPVVNPVDRPAGELPAAEKVQWLRALDDAAKTSPIVARERARLESNSRRYAAGRLEKLRKFAQFLMFERLFSIWHVVHYPLFIVLVVAVIVHIVAVHMY